MVSGFFLPLLSWLIIRTIRSHLATVFSISQNLEKQSIEHLKPINPIVPKEIEPLVNSLNTLLSEIAESMQREKRFTSNAAHELRTPLAAIRMHAQVLLSARSTEEARESAQDIMIGIDKASRMITQLLTLARIEHLDERSEVSVDLCIIIQKTLTLMDFKIVKENIDIQLDLKPAPILAKAEHLEIILRNIIENAIIYRSQNGISIIKITCGCIENRTFFQVEDNGIGVEEEKMPYILQRFYRANQNSSVIGSGLGLSIVKQMVDLYHGKIEVSQASIGGFLIRIEFNK